MRLHLLAATMTAGLIGATAVGAHTSSTGQDYSKYRQPNGASCCSGFDCRPARYEVRPDGTIVMFPDERPVPIPRERIVQPPSDDGLAHWCGALHRDGRATTFCAILPHQNAAAPGRRHASAGGTAW